MNPNLSKLIPYIISEVKKRGGYVTKTKLLKFLYLFDVNYYRKHRETYTGIDWIYFHFGPWFETYDALLKDYAEQHLLERTPWQKDEMEGEFLDTKLDVNDEFLATGEYLALKGLFGNWAKRTTSEMLNDVYFYTEPILNGTRYERLDFSTISEDDPLPKYKRNSSNTPPKKLKELKAKAAAIFAEARTAEEEKRKKHRPIEYDETFFRGMESLDKLD